MKIVVTEFIDERVLPALRAKHDVLYVAKLVDDVPRPDALHAVIATSTGDSGIDIYMGSGGAPEGVLAAAALRAIGGQIQGRLLFRNEDEKGRAHKIGITDLNRKYDLLDLAKGDVMFAATGVTDGPMLTGVRRVGSHATTHSMVMRSKSGTASRQE